MLDTEPSVYPFCQVKAEENSFKGISSVKIMGTSRIISTLMNTIDPKFF
jgi:hypothetical protein